MLRLQTEGEAPNRIQKNDAVQVLEVRQGNVLSYLQAGDYTGEGCFLEDSNGIYRFETTTTAMVDSDLCYLLKADLAEVKEEFPEVETSIQTVMNQKAMLERPRRMFGEAAGGDGSLSPLEVRELLISQLHFSEGPELDELITTMAKGGGVVDEFEFAAWFRAHEAAEQEQYREILEGETLGELVQWVTTAHLENGQLDECLDSPKPHAALVNKILSSPRLLRLLHEDQAMEREYFSRLLKRELEIDPQYLVNRLDERRGIWRARTPELDPQMLRDALHGVGWNRLASALGRTPQVSSNLQVIGRVLAQLPLLEEVRQDEEAAWEAQGLEPPDRLLYSTREELSAVVLRGELAELSLGSLHGNAREELVRQSSVFNSGCLCWSN